MNAKDYIIQTFKNFNIIGLGEGGHHLDNSHQFFEKLFENKKIQEIVDIITKVSLINIFMVMKSI